MLSVIPARSLARNPSLAHPSMECFLDALERSKLCLISKPCCQACTCFCRSVVYFKPLLCWRRAGRLEWRCLWLAGRRERARCCSTPTPPACLCSTTPKPLAAAARVHHLPSPAFHITRARGESLIIVYMPHAHQRGYITHFPSVFGDWEGAP